PQVDLNKGAMRLIGGPTEPLLAPTRRWIQPIGGVDVTPVVWVGLISLLRELLVGQQGLITQVMLGAATTQTG
ncbi:MAG: YggT family protein, partial [Cyanobacteriota bacterium]|nr:YggT family protein [Cyanobacteriota bacterium]